MTTQVLWSSNCNIYLIIVGLYILFKATVLAKFATLFSEVLLNIVGKWNQCPNLFSEYLYWFVLLNTFLNNIINTEIHNIDTKKPNTFLIDCNVETPFIFANVAKSFLGTFCNCGVLPYLQTIAPCLRHFLYNGAAAGTIFEVCGKSKVLNIYDKNILSFEQTAGTKKVIREGRTKKWIILIIDWELRNENLGS